MFGFPEKDREEGFQYRRNFLRAVILRIDYPQSREIVNRKDAFKDTFKDLFPNSSDIVDAQGVLRFEDKTPIFEPQSSSEQGAELKSKDLQQSLKVTDTFTAYTVSGNVYTNFEEIFSVIERAFETMQNNGIQVEGINRIAVRKTNVIDFTIAEGATIVNAISSMFNNALNKSILELPNNNTIDSYNQTIVYSDSHYKLNLNYGYRVGADQDNWSAIIDVDVFNEASSNDFKLSRVKSEFLKINKAVFNIFHWSLQDSLISELNRE